MSIDLKVINTLTTVKMKDISVLNKEYSTEKNEAERLFNEENGIKLYRYRINSKKIIVSGPEEVLVLAYNMRYDKNYTYYKTYFFFKKGKRNPWKKTAYKVHGNYSHFQDFFFKTEAEARSHLIANIKQRKEEIANKIEQIKKYYLDKISYLDNIEKSI